MGRTRLNVADNWLAKDEAAVARGAVDQAGL
jgi:hypothetical protein